ncbi:hypothetical protein [Yoonia sp. 2307UL14-13]|uniref:hypothetical protein n=1 Tax=Yoonia sp. 2307UL14-13 TaxID=3126506 RepID=UPI00309E3CCF
MDVSVFEDAKTAFFRTDYRAFANLVGDYIPDMDARFEALFGPLDMFEPRGYESCQTILQRRENPSFYQEVILFFPRGVDGPIALHLVGAEIGGTVRVLEFTYNSSVGAVLEGLR